MQQIILFEMQKIIGAEVVSLNAGFALSLICFTA
jgi:hypothetical protein